MAFYLLPDIDDHQSSKGLGRAPRAYKMWSKYKSYLEIEYEAQSQICKGGSVNTKSSLQCWQSNVQQIRSQKPSRWSGLLQVAQNCHCTLNKRGHFWKCDISNVHPTKKNAYWKTSTSENHGPFPFKLPELPPSSSLSPPSHFLWPSPRVVPLPILAWWEDDDIFASRW